MKKLLIALILTLGLISPVSAAPIGPIYAVRNDGILQYTWYWDVYARAWVLIKVELYFGDW